MGLGGRKRGYAWATGHNVLVNDPYGTTNDRRPRFKTTSIPSAQRFTWYKVTVHHVQMNVVRPGIDGALALLGQVGFVAVQDGGSNEGKAIVGGAAGRHTTVGGGARSRGTGSSPAFVDVL